MKSTMEGSLDLQALLQENKKECSNLVYLLHNCEDEEMWMSSLMKIESRLGKSKLSALHLLRCLVLQIDTISALKNIMHLFIRKISDMITVAANETIAAEQLVIVKNFWVVCSNRDQALSHLMFGWNSPDLHEVLPSIASVYIDLFVASNRSKVNKEKLAKRLGGWLSFKLNDRCLKTALLEVSHCSGDGSTLLVPILRKLLMSSPPKKSFMDYLLHFILLRRWTLVTNELADVVQVNLNVKAPKNFVDWLTRKWTGITEYVSQDKSFKGRRVSELLCSLDKEVVEDLIDVFSQCLCASDEVEAETSVAAEDAASSLFVIDTTGTEQDNAELQSKKRKRDESVGDENTNGSNIDKENGQINEQSSIHQKKVAKKARKGLKSVDYENNDGVFGFVLDKRGEHKDRSDTKEIENGTDLVEDNMDVEEMEDDIESIFDEDGGDEQGKDESDDAVEDNVDDLGKSDSEECASGDNDDENNASGDNDDENNVSGDDEDVESEDECDDVAGFAMTVDESDGEDKGEESDDEEPEDGEDIDASSDEVEEEEDNEDEMKDFIVADEEDDSDDDDNNSVEEESDHPVPDLDSDEEEEVDAFKDTKSSEAKTSPKKKPPSVFPPSSKDPALTYFVKTPITSDVEIINVDSDEIRLEKKNEQDGDNSPIKGEHKDTKKATLSKLETPRSKRTKKYVSETDEEDEVHMRSEILVLDAVERKELHPETNSQGTRRSKRLSESSVNQTTDNETSDSGLPVRRKSTRGKSSSKNHFDKIDESPSKPGSDDDKRKKQIGAQSDSVHASCGNIHDRSGMKSPSEKLKARKESVSDSHMSDKERNTNEQKVSISENSSKSIDLKEVSLQEKETQLRDKKDISESNGTNQDPINIGINTKESPRKTRKRLTSESNLSQHEKSPDTSHNKRRTNRNIESYFEQPNKSGASELSNVEKFEGNCNQVSFSVENKNHVLINIDTTTDSDGPSRKDVLVTGEEITRCLVEIRRSLEENPPGVSEVKSPPRLKSTRLQTRSKNAHSNGKERKNEKEKVTPQKSSLKEKDYVSTSALTRIKSKDATPRSSKPEPQNILTDWLRKTPKKEENELNEPNDKFDNERSKVVTVDSSSDGEVFFNQNPLMKSYAQSVEGKSSKHILIEAKSKSEQSKEVASPKQSGFTSPKRTKDQHSEIPDKAETPKLDSRKQEVDGTGEEIMLSKRLVIPLSKNMTGLTPQSLRKCTPRETSPVKSPIRDTPRKQLLETKAEIMSTPVATSTTAATVTPKMKKSPAERRKSLRLSTKKTKD